MYMCIVIVIIIFLYQSPTIESKPLPIESKPQAAIDIHNRANELVSQKAHIMAFGPICDDCK